MCEVAHVRDYESPFHPLTEMSSSGQVLARK
jgi:hypothetical protein